VVNQNNSCDARLCIPLGSGIDVGCLQISDDVANDALMYCAAMVSDPDTVEVLHTEEWRIVQMESPAQYCSAAGALLPFSFNVAEGAYGGTS
jgi:hypothetical protein